MNEIMEMVQGFNQATKPLYDRISDLEAEVSKYRRAFEHVHVASGGASVDACVSCGLDLRDPIHKRTIA